MARRLWSGLIMGFGGILGMESAIAELTLTRLGEYRTALFDQGAAEISAYDPASQRLFISNASVNTLDILNLSNPSAPQLITSLDLSPYGGGVNSVAVNRGRIAVAIENTDRTAPGSVVFFDAQGVFQVAVQVGALPDMVTFSPDGRYLLVANEGEPNDAYTVDPEGSVSVIPLPTDLKRLTQAQVKHADFQSFNDALPAGVRVFGPNATPAQDLEPEYITVSPDSRTAWITLQEKQCPGPTGYPKCTNHCLISAGGQGSHRQSQAQPASPTRTGARDDRCRRCLAPGGIFRTVFRRLARQPHGFHNPYGSWPQCGTH